MIFYTQKVALILHLGIISLLLFSFPVEDDANKTKAALLESIKSSSSITSNPKQDHYHGYLELHYKILGCHCHINTDIKA